MSSFNSKSLFFLHIYAMPVKMGEHECYRFIPVYILYLPFHIPLSIILSFLRSKLSARRWLQAHTGGAGRAHCGLLQWVGTGSTGPRGAVLCARCREMG